MKKNLPFNLQTRKILGLVDRLLVVEILDSVFIRKETITSFFLTNQKELLNVKTGDLAYANRVSKQILKNLDEIDHFFSSFLKTKTEKTILNILRLAVFQIYFENRQPYACVDGAVKITKVKFKKKPKASGFVNAILRSVLRNQTSLENLRERSVGYRQTELSEHFLQFYGKSEQE